MSLPNYLASIKSAGIYRFVWDKSEVTATEAETLRLVVGYSEKGQFNTPVYCRDANEFKTNFGGISKKLEKRGIFFHRMALQALTSGPIIALNLKKFTTEKVGYVTSNDASEIKMHSTGTDVTKIYDTSRFWTLEPEKLADLPNADTTVGVGQQYLTLAAADNVALSNSVFMRPCKSTGYDVTIKSWFTAMNEEIPDYLTPYTNMHVADFFAEVFVFKGQFTPAVAQSEELKKFFNVTGDVVTLKEEMTDAFGSSVDVLETLAANENSGFIQRYQGVMLPYFKNSSGAYISLDLIFNGDFDAHHMMMHFNGDLFDDETKTPNTVATYGWDRTTQTDIKNSIKAATNITVGTWAGVTILADKAIKPYSEVMEICTGTSHDTETIDSDEFGYTIETRHTFVDENGEEVETQGTGDICYKTVARQNWDMNYSVFNFGDSTAAAITRTDKVIKIEGDIARIFARKFKEGERFIAANPTDATKNVIATVVKSVFTKAVSTNSPATLEVTFDIACDVIKMKWAGSHTNDQQILVRCNNMLMCGTATSPMYITGYTQDASTIKPATNSVEDKLAWQQLILGVLSTDSSKGYPGLVEALTDRNNIDYRYIVDTFDTFIEEEIKATLATLAKKKENCMLLSNFPSIDTFMKSKNTSFTDSKGVFQMKYVKAGGNSSKPMSVKFGLPSEENGASFCSFNTPVIFSDGTLKTIVPVAALVSNNFMVKYTSRKPYYVVAGANYGRLRATGMVGPEYIFSKDERDILEPMGVNCTVYALRKGTYINSNQTAKQNPVTALSKINIRELVIYLQDQIEDLLLNYQWELNDDTLRNMIKKKADAIMENVQANHGLYAFNNVCDSSNNTEEVIQAEMIILDSEIEPAYGAGKMVQQLTIRKTGEISAKTSQG